MSGSWVAASIRGRGLTRHIVGPEAAELLSASSSLGEAVDSLSHTAYGSHDFGGLSLRLMQHTIQADALWQLRVLAGWCPALDVAPLRVIALRYEISNILGRLCEPDRESREPEFVLGTLGTAWSHIAEADSAAAIRRALALSAWGDPGGDDLAVIRLHLELVWARELALAAPGTDHWGASYGALLAAKLLATGANVERLPEAHRLFRHLLGSAWEHSSTLDDLIARLPPSTSWVVAGIEGSDDLWWAESRWWLRIEQEASAMKTRPPGPSSVVGAGMSFLADARRLCGALELAAAGGGSLVELSHAPA